MKRIHIFCLVLCVMLAVQTAAMRGAYIRHKETEKFIQDLKAYNEELKKLTDQQADAIRRIEATRDYAMEALKLSNQTTDRWITNSMGWKTLATNAITEVLVLREKVRNQ